MTKDQFIAAVEAKTNFIKWVEAPNRKATDKDSDTIQHWFGRALFSTADGWESKGVWFLWDTQADEAHWDGRDTVEPEANTSATKQQVLQNYIDANFLGGKVVWANLDKNYAECEVYATGVGKKTILVYKPQGQPLTHIDA